MELIKTVLVLCSFFAVLYLIFYILVVIQTVWAFIRGKETDWGCLNPVNILFILAQSGNKKWAVIIAIILILGIPYAILDHFCATTEIGAFLEKRGEFNEKYEALVYIEEKPVFCIVDISKTVDPESKSTDYTITQIEFPYGGVDYDLWADYDPDREKNQVPLGHNWWTTCEISVGKVATDQSYEVLNSTVVTAYGELCGSVSGEKYHHNWCSAAKRIKDESRVFFASEREADILGYEPCKLCFED